MQQLIPHRLRAEDGVAMTFVVLMTAMLLLLSGLLIQVVSDDSSRANTSIQRDAALAAAEAGVDNYLSKLVDDNQYYLHDVAAGESTRQSGAVTTVGSCGSTPAPATWTGGTTWTYPNGQDQWCSLANGYQFNLQIVGASAGSSVIDIVSTGRKTGTTTNYRKLEVQVRPSSVADFQMLANADISYGSTAYTYGKIYAGIDSNGVKHNIDHQGYAYGNLYAEGTITGNPQMSGTPTPMKYTQSTIRSVIKNPIDFSNFTSSLTDIKRAADLNLVGGVQVYDLGSSNPGYPPQTSYPVFELTFNSGGTVTVSGCTNSGSNQPEDVKPTCVLKGTYPVPANGAIYSQNTVVIADGTSTCGPGPYPNANCVNGRVTVVSGNDIVVGDDLDYVQTGDDVLGLIATNDVIVAQWAPTTLHWRAATIAQNGQWRSAVGNQTHNGTATFNGSTATNQGGYMSMYQTRVYQYDQSLSYLQPPWFPTIDFAYTVLLYREQTAP